MSAAILAGYVYPARAEDGWICLSCLSRGRLDMSILPEHPSLLAADCQIRRHLWQDRNILPEHLSFWLAVQRIHRFFTSQRQESGGNLRED